MRSNTVSSVSDNDDDLQALLDELASLYGDLASALSRRLPMELDTEIRALGQRIEALMDDYEQKITGAELDEPLSEYAELIQSEVQCFMDRVRDLKSCLRQLSR